MNLFNTYLIIIMIVDVLEQLQLSMGGCPSNESL